MFIKYDNRQRPVMQGLYLNTAQITRAALQDLVNKLCKNSNTAYPINAWYESRGAIQHGYTNTSFPKANADNTALEVLSVNFYDTYDFDDTDTIDDFSYVSQGLPGESTPVQALAYGKSTGSKRLVLGTTTWLYQYVFYDKYGRVIQVRSNNHLSTAVNNLITNVYKFDGRVEVTKIYHNAGTGKESTVINKLEYNHQGRLWKVYQNKNGASTDQLIVQYEYNALGQLIDKKLHSTGATFLQSMDYRYNIRGWLTSINNAKLTSDQILNDDSNDYFGMEIAYNNEINGLNNAVQYNGNISALKWKGPGSNFGDVDQKSYKFEYDKENKLEAATYQVFGNTWNKEVGAYNENISYDHNGNILKLQRNQRKHQLTGVVPGYSAESVDNLAYSYNAEQGEQLLKVEDISGHTAGFNNGTSAAANDYTYDVNGNLIADKNKGINEIVYNILGKPTTVTFSDGRKIEYLYDARGNKLTMKQYQGTTLVLTTQYVDGFVYENNALSFFASPEGRVVKNSTGQLEHQYSIADHQGNTRVVFSAAIPVPASSTATFEGSTNAEFQNYPTGGNRSGLELFDHTDAGTTATYSQLLNGGNNSQVGLAKTFKVYPGDKVKVEAYAKYWKPTSNSSNLSAFATAITAAFGVSSTSTGEALKAYNALNSFGGWVVGGTGHESNAGDPKGFVTILLFDKNFNFLDAAWDQLDDTYQQPGALPKTDFDYLAKEVTIAEEGFAYVYLSNESPTFVDIYFDDVTMTHTKTNIIQSNEYYPFGLQAANSWTRDNSSNNFKYNAGTEFNNTTGIYETMFRGYDPALGRFMQVDPLASMTHSMSPYQYANNNPVLLNDPLGLLSSMSEFWDIVNDLWNSDYGGSWSEDGGTSSYGSSMEAFYAGAAYMDTYGMWGGDSFASSFESAAQAFATSSGNPIALREVAIEETRTNAG